MRSLGLTSRLRRRGFTLVELMIVVAIIGMLAAIAIPAFSRYVRKSRSAEAPGHLNKLWAGAMAYYVADHMDANNVTLPKQFPRVGGASSGSWYEIFGAGFYCGCLAGRKCPGGPAQFGQQMFAALNFTLADPHSYHVMFSSSNYGAASQFTAQAVGDLDCDNTLSQFVRLGSIDTATGDVTGSRAAFTVMETE